MVSAFDHILAVVEYAFRDVLAYAQACQLSPPCATQIVRSDYVDPDLLKAGRDLVTLRAMSFGLTPIGALSLPRIDARPPRDPDSRAQPLVPA
jgi:hypothetical protein